MSEVCASELGSWIGPADHLLSWQCLFSGIFFRFQEHVMSSGSRTMLETDCNIKLRLFLNTCLDVIGCFEVYALSDDPDQNQA